MSNKTTAQPVNNNQAKSEEITQNQENTESTVLTGGVSQNYTQNWDSKGRIYYTDENGNKVDFKVNPIKKIGNKIKTAAFNANRWLNETNSNSEAYKQKVNAILTLETLPLGVGKTATQWGMSKLTPFSGKKIAQGVAEGAGSGLVGGGVYGAGNAMIEGENPLVGALKGAGGGLVGGGVLGGVGGQIVKGVKARQLKKIKDTKPLRKAEQEFYNDYIQQTSVKRSDLGNIDFTRAGLETVSKQPEAGRNFATLKKDVKNAKYLRTEAPNHPRTDDIVKFHVLEKDGQEFLIGETSKGKKYYMSKIKGNSETQSSRIGTELPTNIMTDNAENFNPNITKSEDIKNISKKDMATTKREFKQSVEDLKAPKTKKTVIRGHYKNRFWTKNIDDPYTQATQEADEEFNSILNEIKKNPEVLNEWKLTFYVLNSKKLFPMVYNLLNHITSLSSNNITLIN